MGRQLHPATPARKQWLLPVLGGWLVVALASLRLAWPSIAPLRFPDPDDALRLVEVRNWLNGQAWSDLHLYVLDPPRGVLMHWSRLVDAPLAGLILLLRPLFGQAGAEQAAIVIVPLLTLLAAMVLAGRIAARLGGTRAALYSSLLFVAAQPALEQMRPLRIDHHGWQIVALLLALNGLFVADRRKGGWLIGSALAWGMTISLELLPYAALFAAILGLRWLRDPSQKTGLAAMLTALATVAVLLFAATHGTADLISHCDSLSPAYLAALVSAAILVRGIATLPEQPRWRLIALLGGAAGLSLLTVVTIEPACSRGPFAALDPLVQQFWYRNVLEGMPIWHQPLPALLQMLAVPLLGLAACLWMARGAGKEQARDWLELALTLGGFLLVGIAVARASAAAGAVGVVALGAAMPALLARIELLASTAAKIATLAVLLVALGPGMLADGLGMGKPPSGPAGQAPVSAAQAAGSAVTADTCGMPGSLDLFAAHPGAIVFAPLDIGPDLLLRTRVSVVATAHHRGQAAMRDVMAAFMGPPVAAEQLVRKHGARYLVSCSDLGESKIYAAAAPNGLMAQLLANKPPAWLRAAGRSADGSLIVWDVLPPPR